MSCRPMFRRFHVRKVLCSENICSKDPMFRRSYVQKVLCAEKTGQKVIYSEGSMLRRSYIQIYSESPIFRKFFVLCRNKLSVSGKLYKYYNARYQITGSHLSSFGQRQRSDELLSWRVNITMQDIKSQALIWAHSVKDKGQMSFCHGALSVVCPSINRDWDFNQHP